MRSVLGIVLLLQLFASIVVSQKILGCYWGAWTSISQINIKLCTHAYFAFYTTDSSGVITTESSEVVSSFLALKSQNPSVKLIASIGGISAGTESFSAVAASSTLTSKFIANCLSLAKNYDGIDIDWEYPEPHESKNYINLLTNLKSALNAQGKLLTAAVCSDTYYYDIPNVCKNLDLVNLMTYDMQWPLDITGLHTGYTDVDNSVASWISGGCPSSKVVLGLASYGYGFQTSAKSVGVKVNYDAYQLSYREICTKLKQSGWTTLTTNQSPYSYNGKEWICYDNSKSLIAKLNIVKNRNLPGAFFWSTDQDDYDNSCGLGKYPLFSAVYNALGINPTATTTTTKAPTTTKQAPITTTTKAPTQATTQATTQAPIIITTKASPVIKDRLLPDECLNPGEYIQSSNNCFKFTIQTDGNVVLYRVSNMAPLWSSQTDKTCPNRLCMQADGNLVAYNCDDRAAWSSGTFTSPRSTVIMQDDGNVVIYSENKSVKFATNTVSNC